MRKLFSLIAAVLFAGSMMAVQTLVPVSAGEVEDGGQYLITAEGGSAYLLEAKTFAAKASSALALEAANYGNVWTFTKAEETWKISLATGEGLYFTNDNNGVACAASKGADFTIAATEAEATTVYLSASDGTNTRYLALYEATPNFRCYKNTNTGVSALQLYKVEEGEAVEATAIELDQAALTLTPFKTATLVATLTPEGATTAVEWTSSDETVATVSNGKVTAVAVGEAIITAAAGELTATCVVTVEAGELITCAEAAVLAKDEIAYLGEVTVAVVQGGNTYIKDETGYALIFANNYGLKAGDVVKGFVGKSSPYNNLPELIPLTTIENLEVTAGEAPEPEELTAAPTAEDINKYVIIKGVSFKTAEFSSKNITAVLGEEEFTVRNNFNLNITFDTEKKYDIVGTGAIYNTTLQLYLISAQEQEEPQPQVKDTVNIAISAITAPGTIFFVDYTSDPEEGWWDIYGSNDEFEIELSNLFAEQAEGTYAIEDLDPSYSYVVPANTGDTVFFTAGEVVLTITEGVVNVAGQLTGEDEKVYNIDLTYVDPTIENTVVVEIAEAELIDTYASYGLYGVHGFAEDSTYVRLAIWAEEGFQGDFTEEDLDTRYIGSGLIDATGTTQSIFSAAITVTPGDSEGVYQVTADLLCYNNTLYKVTMQIGEEEEGVEETEAATKAIKAIKNGQIIIEKNGIKYTVSGAIIR